MLKDVSEVGIRAFTVVNPAMFRHMTKTMLDNLKYVTVNRND